MPWKWTSSADKGAHSRLQVLTSLSPDKHRKLSTAFCALLDATQAKVNRNFAASKTFKSMQWFLATSHHKLRGPDSKYGLSLSPPGFIPFVLFCCQSVIPLYPPVTAAILEIEVRSMCFPPTHMKGWSFVFSSSCQRQTLSCWWPWEGYETRSPSFSNGLQRE